MPYSDDDLDIEMGARGDTHSDVAASTSAASRSESRGPSGSRAKRSIFDLVIGAASRRGQDPLRMTSSELAALFASRSRSPSPVGHDVLTLRSLVTSKDAGVIIGRAGKNVADLRDSTGVKAGVSKVIPGVHERVLTVSGSVESVAKVRGPLHTV